MCRWLPDGYTVLVPSPTRAPCSVPQWIKKAEALVTSNREARELTPPWGLASLLGGHKPPLSFVLWAAGAPIPSSRRNLPSFTFEPSPSSSALHVPADEYSAFLDGAYSSTKMLWGWAPWYLHNRWWAFKALPVGLGTQPIRVWVCK